MHPGIIMMLSDDGLSKTQIVELMPDQQMFVVADPLERRLIKDSGDRALRALAEASKRLEVQTTARHEKNEEGEKGEIKSRSDTWA